MLRERHAKGLTGVRVEPAREGAIRIGESFEELFDCLIARGTLLPILWVVEPYDRLVGATIDPDLLPACRASSNSQIVPDS